MVETPADEGSDRGLEDGVEILDRIGKRNETGFGEHQTLVWVLCGVNSAPTRPKARHH